MEGGKRNCLKLKADSFKKCISYREMESARALTFFAIKLIAIKQSIDKNILFSQWEYMKKNLVCQLNKRGNKHYRSKALIFRDFVGVRTSGRMLR